MPLRNQQRNRRPIIRRARKHRKPVQPRICPDCELRLTVCPGLVRALSFDVDGDGAGAEVVAGDVVVRFDCSRGSWSEGGPGCPSGVVGFEGDDVVDDAAWKAFSCAGEGPGVDGYGLPARCQRDGHALYD